MEEVITVDQDQVATRPSGMVMICSKSSGCNTALDHAQDVDMSAIVVSLNPWLKSEGTLCS